MKHKTITVYGDRNKEGAMIITSHNGKDWFASRENFKRVCRNLCYAGWEYLKMRDADIGDDVMVYNRDGSLYAYIPNRY